MTFVPIVPHISGRSAQIRGPAAKPSWLRLESGEVFVRAYGAGSACAKQGRVIAIAIGLAVMVALGVLNFAFVSQRTATPVAAPPDSSYPWISIAIGAILVINVAVVVAIKAARRGKAAAYLTTKMLVVRQGKDYAGVPLADISAILQGTGADQGKLVVKTRTAQQPVAWLPVAQPAADLAELVAYSKAAGAKLQ